MRRRRIAAIGKMLVVVLVWSSSFVGVKVALSYAGPLTIAAYRYFFAFVLLLPWLVRRKGVSLHLGAWHWLRFAAMGIAQYTIGNGVLYIAMRTITATTGSLALCFLPIPVSLLGYLLLGERVTLVRLTGLTLTVVGSLLYFSNGLAPGEPRALLLLGVATLCASAFPVLGRQIAKESNLSAAVVTGFPLGIGGGVLLVWAFLVEGIPRMPLIGWGLVLGLATINTLLPYLLYSSALRTLHAIEANIFVSLTPLGTSLVALVSLGEQLAPLELVGLVAMVCAAVLVQFRKRIAI